MGQVPIEAAPESKSNRSQWSFGALLSHSIVPKILGMGSSVAVVGILFTLQKWNGFREMLLIGSSTLPVALLFAVIAQFSNEAIRSQMNQRLWRAVPLMLLALYFLWVHGLSPS
jgi:hypothetical protein